MSRPQTRLTTVWIAMSVASAIVITTTTSSAASLTRVRHTTATSATAVTSAKDAKNVIDSKLAAVTVAPRSTATWALGHTGVQNAAVIGDYVLQRHGKTWSRPRIVGAPKYSTHLNGIAAGSAKVAWVVGDFQKRHTTSPYYRPLLATSTGGAFHRTAVPDFTQGRLIGIAASSRTNAWAVGVLTSGQGNVSFHWNGKTWSKVAMPIGFSGTPATTATVSTAGPDDAWALGSSPRVDVWHWDGHRWSVVGDPLGPDGARAIATTGSRTWLVGAAINGATTAPAAWRWHGASETWTPVTLAHAHTGGVEELDGVAVVGSKAYAVGYRQIPDGTFNDRPIGAVLHGSKGTITNAQRPAPHAVLTAVAASSKLVVGVGLSQAHGYCQAPFHPLAVHLAKHSKWRVLSIPQHVVPAGKRSLSAC